MPTKIASAEDKRQEKTPNGAKFIAPLGKSNPIANYPALSVPQDRTVPIVRPIGRTLQPGRIRPGAEDLPRARRYDVAHRRPEDSDQPLSGTALRTKPRREERTTDVQVLRGRRDRRANHRSERAQLLAITQIGRVQLTQ